MRLSQTQHCTGREGVSKMGESEYEIINREKNVGTYLTHTDLKDMINVSEDRKPNLHKKLLRVYENLEGQPFKNQRKPNTFTVK